MWKKKRPAHGSESRVRVEGLQSCLCHYNHGIWQASLLNLFQASAPLMKSRSRSAHLKGSWFPESPLGTHHRLDTVLGLENCGKPKTVLAELLCSRLWPRFAEKTRGTLVPHVGSAQATFPVRTFQGPRLGEAVGRCRYKPKRMENGPK